MAPPAEAVPMPKHPPASSLIVLAALVPITGTRAQTTWTVTQQNGVQAAIAAAAPGDVILLPNTGGFPDYTPFAVTKGVTIRGNGCRVGWPLGASSTFELTIQVPLGERAHLDGLDLTWSQHSGGNIGMRIVHNGGVASVQRCNVLYAGGDAARIAGGAIVFQSCSLHAQRVSGIAVIGTAAGVFVQGGNVTVRDSSVHGFDAGIFWFGGHAIAQSAQPGADLVGGSLHAERSTFVGGSGVTSISFLVGGCGVRTSGAAAMWLGDCTLAGGSTAGLATGGPALCNNGGTTAHLANVTLSPGVPGAPPSTGSVNPAAPLVRLALAPAFQRGATSTLAFAGEPGALFVLGLALDAAPTLHPFLVEPVWIVANVPVALGLLDATGGATFAVAVPAGPSLQNQLVFCQAISGFALPLRASTIAGGLIP